MADVEKNILNAKEKMPEVTPTPPGLHSQAEPSELKSRLMWGEPALTIIDVRDRTAFNECHIMGAVAMPMETLVGRAQDNLESNRDIYIYGNDDQQTSQAAQQLRDAGYLRVAEIKGGLPAWQEIAGQVEGTATANQPVGAAAYNTVDRLKKFSEVKDKQK